VILAIHHKPGSFSDRWLEYCKWHSINFKLVNCLGNNVIRECADSSAVLWNWNQEIPAEILIARQVIAALESKNIYVFPNLATCWHFDDKLGQKFLLEAVGAPLVPTYAFFDKESAMAWIEQTEFPKVFKLRNGAGSTNVKLVDNPRQAKSLCATAFSQGFVATSGYFADCRTKIRKIRSAADLVDKIFRMPGSLLTKWKNRNLIPRERGYVLFQDFIDGNTYDTRIVIIGRRAFGFTRGVRPSDFRASGSGMIDLNREQVDLRCVQIAFEVSQKIGAQSLAFDFVKDDAGCPLIVEISYTYLASLAGGVVCQCGGHWDEELNWHDGNLRPEDAIIEDVIEHLNKSPRFP
jgi:hypothetical protein